MQPWRGTTFDSGMPKEVNFGLDMDWGLGGKPQKVGQPGGSSNPFETNGKPTPTDLATSNPSAIGDTVQPLRASQTTPPTAPAASASPAQDMVVLFFPADTSPKFVIKWFRGESPLSPITPIFLSLLQFE